MRARPAGPGRVAPDPLTEMAPQGALRFAVGTPGGPRSATWQVWVGKDGSVFVSTRTLGGYLKVSLHASGRWRIAFTHPAAAARIGAPGGDRAFDRFTPGPEISPGVRHGVMVVIPWLAVGLLPSCPPEEGETYWLPPLAEGQVACIPVFLTAPNVIVDGAIASTTGPTGTGASLKYATRAARPEEVAEWADLDALMAEDDSVEAARTTAEVDVKGFVVGTMPDGTRWLLDLRIPESHRSRH